MSFIYSRDPHGSIMYAGDTVIYYAHSDINVIEKVLNEEMNYFSRYFLSK